MVETHGRFAADQVSRQKTGGGDVSTSGGGTESATHAAPAASNRVAAM